MPKQREGVHFSLTDRKREIASILANGVARWCRRMKTVGASDDQKSPPGREIGLEVSGEMRLSVVNGTRGLRLRDDGDET